MRIWATSAPWRRSSRARTSCSTAPTRAGVRYFDVARSYGLAERFLGSWLLGAASAPSDVTVGSKWGYTYTADWQVDADPPEVQGAHRRDLQAPDRGDPRASWTITSSLYQIHSATLSSGVLDDAELREELARLRDGGVAIGLSTSGTEQAATIERALEVGRLRQRAVHLEPARALDRGRAGGGAPAKDSE